ncbi:MAG: Hpt domain-containing protein [Pseudomonadales bacterium]|nr:Hpt domain-containing protein [Pseudomonadales bacterium]
MPHLDYTMLDELKEIMDDEFLALLRAFLSDSDTRVKSLRVAYDAGDHDNARAIAHSFKGSSGNMGAAALSQLCTEIEQLAKDGRTLDAGTLIGELEGEYKSVATEIMGVISSDAKLPKK